jgi:hypothetical protein
MVIGDIDKLVLEELSMAFLFISYEKLSIVLEEQGLDIG